VSVETQYVGTALFLVSANFILLSLNFYTR
jgi:hypothetical protein